MMFVTNELHRLCLSRCRNVSRLVSEANKFSICCDRVFFLRVWSVDCRSRFLQHFSTLAVPRVSIFILKSLGLVSCSALYINQKICDIWHVRFGFRFVTFRVCDRR